MRQHPTILMASLLVFCALTATGLIVCKVSFDEARRDLESEALHLAEETLSVLKARMDLALLPMFSLAQFVNELSIFRDLPGKIGEAGLPGSLPFLPLADNDDTDGDADGYSMRNITGVCDDPTVIERYQKIIASIQKNSNNVVQNLHLIPAGVMCTGVGTVAMDDVIGLDVLNAPKYRDAARATIVQTDLTVDGPLILQRSCPECGTMFIARLPVVSETYTVTINGTAYPRWGFVSALLSWNEIAAETQLYARLDGFAFELSRMDDRASGEKVLIASSTWNAGFDQHHYASSDHHNDYMSASTLTDNGEWILEVHLMDHSRKQGLMVAVSILGSFLIALLVYTILVQKQLHTVMKGASLAQAAKVDVERNMTAYFAHGTYSCRSKRDTRG